MSDGDWYLQFTYRLIGGLFAAIAIALVIWAWDYGLDQERFYEQEARNAHADYAKHTCYQIDQPGYAIAPTKQANSEPCAPDEQAKEQNDNARDYADLVAQRSSALWAKIMGIAALFGVGLSAVGVALVWITFRETKKGAAASESAAQAAWVIGKTQAEPIFVAPNVVLGTYQNHEMPFHFGLNIKNIGKTPALDVTVNLVWKIVDRETGNRWEGVADLEMEEKNLPADMSQVINVRTKLDAELLDGMTPESCPNADITVDIHITCKTVFKDRLEVVWRRKAEGHCVGELEGFNVPALHSLMGMGRNEGSIIHHSRQTVE